MLSNTLRYLDDGSIELIEQEVGDPRPGEVQTERRRVWHLLLGYCHSPLWKENAPKWPRPVTREWATWLRWAGM